MTWIFCNHNMLIDCIYDDFFIFIDKHLHIPHDIYPNSKQVSGHIYIILYSILHNFSTDIPYYYKFITYI